MENKWGREALGSLRRALTGITRLLGEGARRDPAPIASQSPAKIRHEPIFVFQMGRVGSCSVRDSIKDVYETLSIPISIYHTHWQNDFDTLEAVARKDHTDPTLLLKDLQDAKEIRRKLVDEATVPCNLISLVRDPVARNMSTFFYALPEFLPDWEQKMKDGGLSVEDLHENFARQRGFHTTPARWFDEQLKPVFDIDVYATDFPRELGYKIYSSRKARLLVLRLESLAMCSSQAITEFLGLPNFKLRNDNTGEERNTGELYRLFKTKPISPSYIEQMYASKYARHFYSGDELAAFTAKWLQRK